MIEKSWREQERELTSVTFALTCHRTFICSIHLARDSYRDTTTAVERQREKATNSNQHHHTINLRVSSLQATQQETTGIDDLN